MIKKIKVFEYDTTPTENSEIVVAFRVGESHCEMKISEKILRDMLSWIELKTLCLNCRSADRDHELGVCGSCYHEQISKSEE